MKHLIAFLKGIATHIGAMVIVAAVAVSIWLLAGLNGRLDTNNRLLIYQIQQLEEISKMRSI